MGGDAGHHRLPDYPIYFCLDHTVLYSVGHLDGFKDTHPD